MSPGEWIDAMRAHGYTVEAYQQPDGSNHLTVGFPHLDQESDDDDLAILEEEFVMARAAIFDELVRRGELIVLPAQEVAP